VPFMFFLRVQHDDRLVRAVADLWLVYVNHVRVRWLARHFHVNVCRRCLRPWPCVMRSDAGLHLAAIGFTPPPDDYTAKGA
jgi:hypothetical protein